MVFRGELKVSIVYKVCVNPSGMVHVSNITNSRIQSPSDVLKRNDRVKVKVMSIAANKYGLSMKDVDQTTGADLS